MSTGWIADQLLRTSARAVSPQAPRFNPRPAGVIRPGSATNKALVHMCRRPAAWMTHAQLISATGATTKALCWALAFLRETGLVEVTSDDARNYRYLRYRITNEGVRHATEHRLLSEG